MFNFRRTTLTLFILLFYFNDDWAHAEWPGEKKRGKKRNVRVGYIGDEKIMLGKKPHACLIITWNTSHSLSFPFANSTSNIDRSSNQPTDRDRQYNHYCCLNDRADIEWFSLWRLLPRARFYFSDIAPRHGIALNWIFPAVTFCGAPVLAVY